MKTLLLLRHAKSSWKDPMQGDFDRPLNKRGRRAAKTMGRYLREKKLIPDLILCSGSRRTVETLDFVVAKLKTKSAPQISILDDLYLASAEEILGFIRKADSPIETILVIGHNPGTETLAQGLLDKASSNSNAVQQMAVKYPTGSLAHLDAAIDTWAELSAGRAKLISFTRPRDLDEK